MSSEQIREISSEMARKAKGNKVVPIMITADNLNLLYDQKIKIPFLGDYVPEGWNLEDEIFVDSSGFGSEGEPAKTWRAFCSYVSEHLDRGYAVSQVGAFQVYVRIYRKN